MPNGKQQNGKEQYAEAMTVLPKLLEEMPTDFESDVVKESFEILKFSLTNSYLLAKVLYLKTHKACRRKVKKADKERKEFFKKGIYRFQPYVDDFYQQMITNGLVEQKATKIYA